MVAVRQRAITTGAMLGGLHAVKACSDLGWCVFKVCGRPRASMLSKNDLKSTSGSPVIGPEGMLKKGDNLPKARVARLDTCVRVVRIACKALSFGIEVHVRQHVVMPSLDGWEFGNDKGRDKHNMQCKNARDVQLKVNGYF